MARTPSRFACVFALLLLAGGCSSNGVTSVSLSPQTTFVGSGQTTQFTATVTGGGNSLVTWAVNGVVGGTAATGTIDANGDYSAPDVAQNATATVTATDGGKSASATVSIVAPGVVTATNEPQVAQYTINPPAGANVSIEFGTDTNYGKTTWSQPTPAGGGPVSMYVAGMLANTLYHMRAVIQFDGNNTVDDSDHTFTTGTFPAAELPTVSASTSPGMTPQSGVELLSMRTGNNQLATVVTDLAGNVLWGYNSGLTYTAFPIKLMPNGDFLVNYAAPSPDGADSVLREVDLGGNVVWQLTAAQLNQELAAATCPGCNITVVGTHHDFALLPNGHIIVIASEQKSETGLTGEPSPVTVTGDVLIDLDQNHQPVWVWSEFDHLDLNRHPMSFPDWTHTNAVVYSPSDHDLIISVRHQYWVMKIDYNDGQGTGDILWKLGWQGEFTLMYGTDPVDWQYAQHDANVMSSNSAGTFQMTMFDNGDNRVMDSSGDICGASGQPACYSRIPIFQIDEAAKTATLEWVDNLSPTYSLWGGNSRLLANGDMEFDECALGSNSAIYEVTQTTPPMPVWQMHVTGQNVYRGFRIPSLYPGVQW
jgi:arylsulfate sulfotransferase